MNLKPRMDSPQEDLLEGWKAIAQSLHRDVRTARRWERIRGMPVHRLPGGDKPGVYASRAELKNWLVLTCPKRSVGVLPFTDLTCSPWGEVFVEGLTDRLATLLTATHRWMVAARSSALAARGRRLSAQELGEMLGVRLLLEGTVQCARLTARITAQLVDTASGYQLWSEQYDRPQKDLFAAEDRVAADIVSAVLARMEGYN